MKTPKEILQDHYAKDGVFIQSAVEAMEEYGKLKWDEACEATRSNCMQRFHDNTETQLRIGSVPQPEFKP